MYISSATSVPVERAFSLGANLISKQRSSLTPNTIRACTCLKGWLKKAWENKVLLFYLFFDDFLTLSVIFIWYLGWGRIGSDEFDLGSDWASHPIRGGRIDQPIRSDPRFRSPNLVCTQERTYALHFSKLQRSRGSWKRQDTIFFLKCHTGGDIGVFWLLYNTLSKVFVRFFFWKFWSGNCFNFSTRSNSFELIFLHVIGEYLGYLIL